jgi:FlaA1/EpsC-like NDP-sugar epimerase
MFEELSYGDNLIGTAHPRIMTVAEEAISVQQTQEAVNQLKNIIDTENYAGLIQIMSDFADYTPEALPAIFAQKTVPGQPDTKIVSLPVSGPSKKP